MRFVEPPKVGDEVYRHSSTRHYGMPPRVHKVATVGKLHFKLEGDDTKFRVSDGSAYSFYSRAWCEPATPETRAKYAAEQAKRDLTRKCENLRGNIVARVHEFAARNDIETLTAVVGLLKDKAATR